jgi:hypothetical protein
MKENIWEVNMNIDLKEVRQRRTVCKRLHWSGTSLYTRVNHLFLHIAGEFLDQLSDYQLFKSYFDPYSYLIVFGLDLYQA